MIDSLFTGNVLGHASDIADGSLRGYEFRWGQSFSASACVCVRACVCVCVCVYVFFWGGGANVPLSIELAAACAACKAHGVSEQHAARVCRAAPGGWEPLAGGLAHVRKCVCVCGVCDVCV
jgi:hypothetical protein